MTGNQSLDVNDSKDVPLLIVAGHIVGTDVKPRPPAAEDYPADVSFRFKVTSVVRGQETYKGQTLFIPATSFDWPTALLAFQKGVRCALVLRTDGGDNGKDFYLCSVVPVGKETLRTAQDGEEAKRILAAELLVELKNEKTVSRQREIIHQVSPILQKVEAEALVPFLKSEDTWLRRAALVGLICATKETNYLEMAHQDIERFIKTTDPASMINDPGGHPGFAPYPLFFSYYFFLGEGYDQGADAAAYLPLFRLMAHSTGLPERDRWDHGVRPLCRLGSREDAKFLYDYCRGWEGKKKKELPLFESDRKEIIIGISRMLNLGLPNWVESDFLKVEQEQHRQISDALVKAGLIKKGEVHSHPVK
jgi:hypothetical protein